MADLRAPTPSAAAELVTPDLSQVLAYFQGIRERIKRKVFQKLDFSQKQLLSLKSRPIFKNPESFLKLRQISLERSAGLLRANAAAYLSGQTKRLDMASQRLSLLNPWNVLARGYSVLKKDNHVIHSVNQLQISDRALLWLSDGQAEVQVLSLKEERKRGNGDKENGAENHEV